MKIINCTPHKITVLSRKGVEQDSKKQFLALPEGIEVLAEIEPSGVLPRVQMSDTCVGDVQGIPLHEVIYGNIENLPPVTGGTLLIVSGVVAAAAAKQGRKDVIAPGGLVRDKNNPGIVLGCLFLQKP